MNQDVRYFISDSSTDLIWIAPDNSPRARKNKKMKLAEYHQLGEFPGDLVRFLYLDLSQAETVIEAFVKVSHSLTVTHEAACGKQAMLELKKLGELHPYFIVTEREWLSRISGVILAAEDDAAAELPLEQMMELPSRLRQIQQAGLNLISQVLDIDLDETSLLERMKQYTARHKTDKTPCYEFRKLTTQYGQENGIYLEELYPNGIFDLIDYSLQRCLEKGLRFRVCKNCGRYFAINRSAKAEYCDTFPDENGRTCRNVGAITAWTKKRENDDVFMTYRREYKKRFARIRSGTLLPEEFYRWSEQARQKKNQLEAGEIDADTFLAWLANS